MAGAGEVPSVTVTLLSGLAQRAELRPGQVLQGTIQGIPESLFLIAGAARVPLEAPSMLRPGQRVLVEVAETRAGIQLRLTPQPAEPVSSPEPPQGLASVVVAVLESLNALDSAEVAPRLIPDLLPRSEEPVRQLLTLFAQRGSLGEDLQQITALVDQAAASGAVPQPLAESLAAAMGRLVPYDVARVQEVLQHLAASNGRSVEAHVAAALASGQLGDLVDRMEGDLRVVLAQLRENAALGRYLDRSGQTQAFQAAVGRILERLAGGQYQNLRGLDFPYLFFEIPFPSGGPLRYGQVHFFGDRGARAGFDGQNATVILDVSTTHLGDLWISLKLVVGRCSCWFRATSAAVVEAIDAGREDLVEALARAGYPGATVRAMLWDGKRLEAAASLMRRFAAFEANA